MNSRLPSFLALVALLFAIAAPAAVDRQRAGIVTAIRGEVSLKHADGQPQTPGIKAEVFEGDLVTTGERGRVQICFEDDSILSIGRGATVEIPKFLFDPSANKGAMQIVVKEGFFRLLGGAVTRIAPENFETVAGTASIGIRGCSFGGQVVNGMAYIVFFGSNIGGNIEVTGAGVRRPIGTPGNGVTVPRDGPPSIPSPMERFGVQILTETHTGDGGDGGTGGGEGGDGESPRDPGGIVDPTKIIDESLPNLIPSEPVMHGFSIGEELETGWLYKNGSPELLSLQLTTEGDLLTGINTGRMTVSVHSNANFSFERNDNFLLPVLTFDITDGTFSDGVDLTGNTVVAVADSMIKPVPEAKSYMNWGKWEMTIVDPNAVEREMEVRTVRGLWIATDLERTNLDTLHSATGDLILGGNFRGSYDGEAHCLRNGTDGLDGASHFEINFHDQSFTGQFDFSGAEGPNFTYNGTVLNTGRVEGTCTSVSGETVITSESLIEGALYDKGTVIGTAWNALTTENSYIGVAGAQGTISAIGTSTSTGGGQ